MTTWLDDVTDRLARAAGVDPAGLTVTPDDATLLLELAAFAAHDSGERTNAPLLCHVLGALRASGASLEDLAEVVRKG